ncbi:MAG: cupin domain-containing protein [Spirochaetes bacterium]|nr:MAG: cupin domain-containing protein [Spirochaetota bacterium]
MSPRKKKKEPQELESSCRGIDPGEFLQGPEWDEYVRGLCARHQGAGVARKPGGGGLGYTVIRKDEAARTDPARMLPIDSIAARPGKTPGPAGPLPSMRAFVITLTGKGRRRECASHRGEEFILVRKGSIKIFLGEEEILLREGDSVYYRSSIPHRIENRTFRKSIIVAVICGL